MSVFLSREKLSHVSHFIVFRGSDRNQLKKEAGLGCQSVCHCLFSQEGVSLPLYTFRQY